MREYQQYLEKLVNTRLNFFLLFFAVIIGASPISSNSLHLRLILSIGSIVSVMIALGIARAQLKMNLAIQKVFEDEDQPPSVIDKSARGQFPPSMRNFIGYVIPWSCVLILIAAATASWCGVLDPPISALNPSPITTAPAPASSVNPALLDSLIVAGATLGGVMVGSIATYLIQSMFHRRDRMERHSARIREAYANWAGGILREVDALRNAMSFRESVGSASADQAPEWLHIHLHEGMKEMSLAVLDATHKEQVAFSQLLLTDSNKKRLKTADEIRKPIKTFAMDSKTELSETISDFYEIERGFADRLSKYLADTAKSLQPT